MLSPPLSKSIFSTNAQNSTPPTSSNGIVSNPPESSSPILPRHILPAAIRSGPSLARTKDNLDTYYIAELRTERLDAMRSYLWLAGLPSCARPLHRQRLLGREILITEDPNEHLVWHETRIFIKPLPVFLFDLDCWTQKICKNPELYEAACGLLLSYAWLVRHESDLRIAHEMVLLPTAVDWAMWTNFIDDFLVHIDLQSLRGISPRFHYGELRLSRLNKIYRIFRVNWRDFVRGYMTASTWYQDFFSHNFAWMLAVFAFLSVALSAMQVVTAVAKGTPAFNNASYGFSIFSLFVIAGTAFLVLFVWLFLFIGHIVSTQMNHRKVLNERQRSGNIQKVAA